MNDHDNQSFNQFLEFYRRWASKDCDEITKDWDEKTIDECERIILDHYVKRILDSENE